MSRLAAVIFWASVATLVYTFTVFPILVIIRGLLVNRRPRVASVTPQLSVLIAAYNEEATIAAKLDNLLSLAYPRDQLEIIVASDGSDDETERIVRRYAESGVSLLALPRGGKAAALEAAVAASSSDVLVFTDANSMFATDALAKITSRYADPQVGGVAGNQVYRSLTHDDVSDAGERAYWGFDRILKEFEGRAGNTISATGAIYSIRRDLFRPIPPGVNDDFYLSLGVIRQGHRLAFAADAVAFEPPASSHELEYARKVRVITRAMHCAILMRDLLNFRIYGFYSVQFLSHKILRWATFVPISLLVLSSFVLMRRRTIYTVALLMQVAGYTMAFVGLLLANTRVGRNRLLTLPTYFLLANVASAHAAFNLIRRRQIAHWSTSRSGTVPVAQRLDDGR